ncbi:MAG: pyridoxal phosphate-dependent aminotransferase [Sarcina sp.]
MSINHGANIFDLCEKYNVNPDSLMDFSSNINPFGASLKAKEAVIKNIDMVSLYPDPAYKKLKSKISSYCNTNIENIILGNGATELISSFIQTISPKKALLLSPSYSEYEKELNSINCKIDFYFAKKDNDFKIDIHSLISYINNDNFDLIIICNPNNPTGFAFNKNEIKLLSTSIKGFVMIDETYIEFTDMKTFSCTPLINTCSNLFIIRGTSKFFSTPGIRLGYGLISNKSIFNNICKNIDLWSINIFATIMGEVMFSDTSYIEDTYNKIIVQKNYLLENLKLIKSIKVYNTSSNFILCELINTNLTARDLYELLIQNQIIIRDCVSFEGLSKYFFRLCVLKENENKLLIKSLNKILK